MNETSPQHGRRQGVELAPAVAVANAVAEAESTTHKIGVGTRLRNYFVTGLVVVGPVMITLYIAWYVIGAFDRWVKPYIPKVYNPDSYLPFAVPGAGLLFAIIFVTIVGALAANLLGRTLISAGEQMLDRMPIVRNVYKALKQIFESVVTATGPEQPFQKVGLMEFPSPGIWAIVFVTGQASRQFASVAPDEELIAVFMPTHLMPPSGFTVFVPRAKVTIVDMSVEDAAKIILSAGMVTPDSQERLKALAETQRRRSPRRGVAANDTEGAISQPLASPTEPVPPSHPSPRA
jgi:uncharacterized membrane protein